MNEQVAALKTMLVLNVDHEREREEKSFITFHNFLLKSGEYKKRGISL